MKHQVDADPAMRVCIFCGSPKPQELLPQCAHGIVAMVRGDERRVMARPFVAFQAMHAQREAVIAMLDKAIAKGAATIDHAPTFDDAGGNVIPLHDRAIVIARSNG